MRRGGFCLWLAAPAVIMAGLTFVTAGPTLMELLVRGITGGGCMEAGNVVVEGAGIRLDVVSLDSSSTR